jgi:hypothetical protein
VRARNLKPGFFKNEDLATIDPLGRILFSGLWCMADRKGRLEDRPQRIKVEILPYDNCDVEQLLSALHEKHFINRYVIHGCKYIEILNFCKHQTPHWQERDSSIPSPDSPKKKPRVIQDKSKINPSDSLTPDSLLLIPDSLTPDLLIHMFKESCPFLIQPEELTEERKSKIKSRLKVHPEKEWWEKVFKKANKVCIPSKNGKGDWCPTFDWMIKNDTNPVKILEGSYPQRSESSLPSAENHKSDPAPDWITEATKRGWK